MRKFTYAVFISLCSILFLPDTSQAVHPDSLEVTLSTAPFLVLDSNKPGEEGPLASYIGFKVRNVSSAETFGCLEGKLHNFTGTDFALAGGQDSVINAGSLLPDSSFTFYFYVTYDSNFNVCDSVTLTLSTNCGETLQYDTTFTFCTVSHISANAGGLIFDYTVGPANNVGSYLQFDVTYEFGNVQNGDSIMMQPAGNLDFDAACWQLDNSIILASDLPVSIPVGIQDSLYFRPTINEGSGTANYVTIRYFFHAECANTSTTAVPFASLTSGAAGNKYTGDFLGTTVPFPEANEQWDIVKSVDTTNASPGDTLTYTVYMINQSTDTAMIDEVYDVLPEPFYFIDHHPDSYINPSTANTYPSFGDSDTIFWYGQDLSPYFPYHQFIVFPNDTLLLKYYVKVPGPDTTTLDQYYLNKVWFITGDYTSDTVRTSVCVGFCASCPEAGDDFATTPFNTDITIDVLANDFDFDMDLDSTSLNVFDPPTNGTFIINPDYTITYDPDYGFVGFDTLRYEICDQQVPNGCCDTAIVVIEVLNTYDFGDAASPFPTLAANNGPAHGFNFTYYLGDTIDYEMDGAPSLLADGDDLNNLDDEDGVVFTSPMIQGASADVTVTASAAGLLDVWIDFNGNGSWDDAGEHVYDDLNLGVGDNSLTFAVPSTATNDTVYTRWRFSSTGVTSYTDTVDDGEVEDYYHYIYGYDFGDAEDPSYPTLAANNGARHVTPTAVFLGANVGDAESDGFQSAGADGDDANNVDDEDGVTITSTTIVGETTTVDIVASTTGYLNAWIDFNQNGSWADAGEQIFTDEPLVAGTNSLNFNVPIDATIGNTFARYRFSTQNGLTFTGAAPDGEVEDYLFEVQDQIDWGDAPDPSYPTLSASNGASHIINTSIYLGDTIDHEPDGIPDTSALGDDGNNFDDEDGVVVVDSLVQGNKTFLTITAVGSGVLNAWIDYDQNGSWEPIEQIAADLALNPGSNTVEVIVPGNAVVGNTFARFRYSTATGLSPTGQAPDGEVEDYLFDIKDGVPLDFGDNPDPAYNTLLANNGPRHIITGGLWLGSVAPDFDVDGQPNTNADGDDLDAVTDDEDGVTFGSLILGAPSSITVVASSNGLLQGWIDYNKDGIFAASERVATDLAVVSGANNVTANIPNNNAYLGFTYARFRISTASGLGPDGPAANGEVEDYQVEIIPMNVDFAVEKFTNGDPSDTPTGPYIAKDSAVTWTYTIQNNGNVDLTSIQVVDDAGTPIDNADDFLAAYVSGDDGDNILNVGETWLFSYDSTATTVGQYANIATFSATDPTSTENTLTDPGHYYGYVPAIHIEKSTNGQDADTPTGPYVAVDSAITWTYTVTNAGDTSLSNIVVTDNIGGVNPAYISGDTDNDNELDTNETWIFEATGIATAGQYTNTGTACGDDINGGTYCDIDSSNYFGFTPGLDIQKLTNGEDADNEPGPYIAVDSTVTWTYQISNTGDTSVTNVTLVDSDLGSITITQPVIGDTDGDGQLDTNETWIIEATGTATAGQYENVGEVCAEAVNGDTYCDTDTSHYFGFTPGLDIQKLTNGEDADNEPGPYIAVDSTVTWTYRISNTGDTSVVNVTLVDSDLGSITITQPVTGDTDGDGQLDTNETWIIETTGTATAGQYENVGEVCAEAVNGDAYCDTDTSHYFGFTPGIQLEKATNGEDADNAPGPYVEVGTTVTWTYTIINNGDTSLTNLTLIDSDLGNITITSPITGDTDGDGELDSNETWTIETTGLATAGQYENIGEVCGEAANGDTYCDTDPSHYFGFTKGITIEKATNGEDADDPTGPYIPVGQTVTWSYTITNQGTLPLENVVVGDDQLGVIAGPDSGDGNNDGKLDPNETWYYFTTGTATAGQYTNVGDVSADAADNSSVTDIDSSNYFGLTTGITIEKSTNGEDADNPTGPYIEVGDQVFWNYVVTNQGNTPLSSVTVADDELNQNIPGPESGDDNNNSLLDPGETWLYSFTGTALAGQYTNVGTATGNDPNFNPVSDIDSSNYYGYQLDIDIEKYTNGIDADFPQDGPIIYVPNSVVWTYDVTNNSNVNLSSVYVYDNILSPNDPFADAPTGDDGDGIFEPGETWTWTRNGNAAPGQYKNIGSVFAMGPNETQVSDVDSSHYFGLVSGITLEKSTSGFDADLPTGPHYPIGATLAWIYELRNNGNAALDAIVLTDDKLGTIGVTPAGDDNNDGKLDPDEIWTYFVAGSAQQLGQYSNLGEVIAYDTTGNQQFDDDPSHYFGYQPEIHIEKTTNGVDADTGPGPYIAVDSTVTWTYTVTNPGDTSLINVEVTDNISGVNPAYVSGDTDGDGELDTNETWIYEATGTATTGQYTNIGSVCAEDEFQFEYCDQDSSNYYGFVPGIQLEKLTNGEDADNEPGPYISVDSTVTWTYQITNTGDTSVTNVTLVDSDLGIITITQPITGDTDGDSQLDTSEIWVIEVTGTATAGQYENVGEVCAEAVNGDTYCDTDTSHYFGVQPSISLEKHTNGVDADNAPGPEIPTGSLVTWTYYIQNNGDSPLSGISLEDSDIGPISITAPINGDNNNDQILDIDETWVIEATGIAVNGQYQNTGTACGDGQDGYTYCDSDDSHYFGQEGFEDYGDAPEGALAYPGSGVIGKFPTCIDLDLAGYVSHVLLEDLYLGPSVDGEDNGNAGNCDPYAYPYNADECFADDDAGLIKPATWTIDAGNNVVPCSGSGEFLGMALDTAQWGDNIDVEVNNLTENVAYVNVLIDFDQNGEWYNDPNCPCGVDVYEHIVVDLEVPAGFSGPLSNLLPPDFVIGTYSGWLWMRISVTDVPVGNDWDGSGQFQAGETEDYLVRVQDYTVVPLSDWAVYVGMILMTIFTVMIIRRRFF